MELNNFQTIKICSHDKKNLIAKDSGKKKMIRLGDIIDKLIGGGTPSRSVAHYWGNEIPWVTVKDFATFDPYRTQESITNLGLKNSASNLIPAGTLITSTRMALGKSVIYEIDVAINQDLKALFIKQGFSVKFVYYWFDHNTKKIEELGSGSTVKGISIKELKNFPFPNISIPEQHAIAEALSDVDALLESLDRLIAKKRDIKQATMQQLLTGEKRLPGFKGEWEEKTLYELARIQRGASPRPIDSPIWFSETSQIGWVRISDVTNSGMFLTGTTQRLSQLGVQHSRFVSKGNLIMSICATVGRPIITSIDVCIHDGFVVFENLKADKKFIYYVLKCMEPNWSKHGQTGSQMNLNTGLISGTKIRLPSLSEQTAIAEVLSDMDTEITTLEKRRDKTNALKQAMMQELLTGRTRLV